MKSHILPLLFSILLVNTSIGQSLNLQPTIEPVFFNSETSITITYNVTGTSFHSATDAWLWIWVPNRSDLTIASNVNPANSNAAASNKAKFTKSTDAQGRQFFSITIKISDFIAGNLQNVTQVGMLLKGNDWPNGQTVDHLANLTTSFTVLLQNPQGSFGFFAANQEINIKAISSEAALLQLYVDDELLAEQANATLLEIPHTIISDGQVHTIKAKATAGANSDEKTFAYTITPVVALEPVPAGMQNGINYHDNNTAATLVLVAPNKQNVFVIGEFNNWQINSNYLMKRDGDRWWTTITGLTPGNEYRFQYLVDGVLRIADPYTEKVGSQFDDEEIIRENRYPGLQPYPTSFTTHELSYLQPGKPAYNWTATNYVRPAKEDLVIYELLIRDFTTERTYKAVTQKLDYLKDLGINAIELLPVMEFEGNLSWGYNPSFMLAPDKYYGTENDLKELIDEAHKRGMAVILDIALNHAFGRSPLVRLYNDGDFGPPTNQNPWLNRTARHDFNVGYDFNHESQYTKDYVDRVVKYWIEEYNIDGYRFDLSKGFTQKNTLGNVGAWGNYDASRVALLRRMANVIWELDPDSYVILEHFAVNNEEIVLSNDNMMLWGNMNHSYRNAAKSAASLSGAYHGGRGWSKPHLISYAESHDEERVMWDVLKTRSESEALARAKLVAAFLIPIPGPKMLWQFGELGYQEELNNDRLGVKPTRWEYLEDQERMNLYNVYAALNYLKTETNYLSDEYFSWDSRESYKWMRFNNPDVKVMIVANFGNTLNTFNPNFPIAGTWYDYLSGQTLTVTNPQEFQLSLSPNEFYILTSQPIENNIDSRPVDFVLSVDQAIKKEAKIFPNPTEGLLNFQLFAPAETIQIRDLLGRVVLTRSTPNSLEVQLNLNELPDGLYLVDIHYTTGVQTQKIIKQ